MSDLPPPVTKSKPLWQRLLPVGVLVAAIALVLAMGWHKHLSYETLRENREVLLAWVGRHGLLAAVTYVGLYALVAALSLPVAVYLTLAGGFLFGALPATIYTVIGATIGACAIFMIASTAIGDSLRKRAGPMMRRMEDGFRKNAFNYMLILRLVPIVPFWAANLVPALLGVRFGVFALATMIGIIPGTAIFCLTGAGLGKVLETQEHFSVRSVLSPELIAGLVGLAVLAVLPVAYKAWRRRRTKASDA